MTRTRSRVVADSDEPSAVRPDHRGDRQGAGRVGTAGGCLGPAGPEAHDGLAAACLAAWTTTPPCARRTCLIRFSVKAMPGGAAQRRRDRPPSKRLCTLSTRRWRRRAPPQRDSARRRLVLRVTRPCRRRRRRRGSKQAPGPHGRAAATELRLHCPAIADRVPPARPCESNPRRLRGLGRSPAQRLGRQPAVVNLRTAVESQSALAMLKAMHR